MKHAAKFCAVLLSLAAMMLGAGFASAQCKITSVDSVSLTGLSSYTPSTSAQSLTATLNVTVTKNNGANNGCTSLALGYTGVSPLLINGTSQLPYTLSTSSGGTSILYNGGTPAAFAAIPVLPNTSGSTTFSVSLFLNVPALTTTQIAALSSGVHSASLTLQVFSGTTPESGLSRGFSIGLTVNVVRVCTVGGSGTPTRGTATVPVASNGRITDVSPITPTLPLGNAVVCTGSGVVVIDLLSQNGRITGPSNSNPAFSNAIDYSASASIAGGTAATFNSSSGVATQGTSGGTSGNLTVSITPVNPSVPLVAGSYADVLTVRITPQ